MWSPRLALDRRSRTREGPEPACVQTPFSGRVAHAGEEERRGKGEKHVLPWYLLVGVVSTSSETQRATRESWSPRGTGMTVLTNPCPTASRVSGAARGLRQGMRHGWWERSKFRWNGRQLTLDKTVSSRVWWHIQGLSELRLDLGWWSRLTWFWRRGRYQLGHRPVVLLRTETALCTVRPT